MDNWHTFYFVAESKDGRKEIEYTHETEEQARRELVHILNHIHKFYPKKITLLKVEKFQKNVWEQLD
jgi:hypothetical protein